MKWFGILTLFVIFLFPQIVKGEITTAWDWVGVFALGAPDGRPAASALWKYTSTCASPATPPPGTAPKSQDLVGCTFSLPTAPAGLYEYRLYANDEQSPEALLAKSKPFSKDFMLTPSCSISGSTLNVTLEWPAMVGNVDKITIVRSDGKYFPRPPSDLSFTDKITGPGASYTYYGIAHSGTLSAESVKEVQVTVTASGSSCAITTPDHNLTFPAPPALPSYGDCKTQSGATTRVNSGLISTPDINNSDNKFGNDSGTCVVDSKAAFAPYRIRNFDDLKSLYYTQAKPPIRKAQVTGSPTQEQFTPVFTQNDVILVNGDLPDLNYTGTTKPTIVFVEGNLSIGRNITYGDASSGLVFVVKGNVIITPAVTRIDAVIISQGKIFTAGADCATSDVPTTSTLTVNGSLVSLDSSKPIVFCRTLADNSLAAAEIIKQEPKYLVILRNLLADTVQRWSEI